MTAWYPEWVATEKRREKKEKKKKKTKTIDTRRYVTRADKCSTVCDEGNFCPGVRT